MIFYRKKTTRASHIHEPIHELKDTRLEPSLLNSEFYSPRNEIEFHISPIRLAQQLLGIISVLLVLSTIGQISRHVFDRGRLLGLVDLFYVDAEANIPTAYSSFAWMLSGGVAMLISIARKQTGDRFTQHWRGLALVFTYLALDELAALHELTIDPLRSLLQGSGLFYFTWVVLGALFFLIFAISYFKFLYSLPPKTRILLMLSAGIFVTGAIGVEMIGGWYAEIFGLQADLIYALIATTEEALEMLGVLTLLYTLLSYMGKYLQPIKINILSR
jgi:hypothetical protein